MKPDKNGLAPWCHRPDLLELWSKARGARREVLPRLVICDLLDDLWTRGEPGVGPEAQAFASCLRDSIGRVRELAGMLRARQDPSPHPPEPEGLRLPVELDAESRLAIPAIQGALHGWPLAGQVNQAEAAARLWLMAPVHHRLDGNTWMEMIPVAPGIHRTVQRRRDAERLVKITFPYLISKEPITHGQWEAVLGERLRDPFPDRPRRATFRAAEEFCARFRQRTGLSIWVPTEAQWECAEDGWDRGPALVSRTGSLRERLRAGGPNNKGFCRGPERCWEWCRDFWIQDLDPGKHTDPVQDIPGEDQARVIRRVGSPRQSSVVGFGRPGGFTNAFRVIQRVEWDGTWKSWDHETGLSD